MYFTSYVQHSSVLGRPILHKSRWPKSDFFCSSTKCSNNSFEQPTCERIPERYRWTFETRLIPTGLQLLRVHPPPGSPGFILPGKGFFWWWFGVFLCWLRSAFAWPGKSPQLRGCWGWCDALTCQQQSRAVFPFGKRHLHILYSLYLVKYIWKGKSSGSLRLKNELSEGLPPTLTLWNLAPVSERRTS